MPFGVLAGCVGGVRGGGSCFRCLKAGVVLVPPNPIWLEKSTREPEPMQVRLPVRYSLPGEPARILAQLGTSSAEAEVTFWLGLVLKTGNDADRPASLDR